MVLRKSSLTINGFELIQKHTLLFSCENRPQNQDRTPDGTVGSIFQFPKDPFQKVFAVKAIYLDRDDNVIHQIQGKIYTIKVSLRFKGLF